MSDFNRGTRRALASNERRQANKARGETILTLENGDEVRLCFTLKAMAEIEAGLGIQSIADIEGALTEVSARKLGIVLGALARGGGEDLANEDVLDWQITIPEAVAAIGECFAASSLGGGSDAKN
jgi:hypothetical protein